MKKILILMMVVFSTIAYSQETTPYIAAGLSMSNAGVGDFNSNSYPSAEIGIMRNNFTLAAVFGRNNLLDADNSGYWTEGKTAYSFPIGVVNGYALLGIGAYFDGGMFIEYGFGVSKDFNNNLGGFIQVSNWDVINYITPGFYIMF